MKTHKLKILAPFADKITSGEKTFEVRRNDRAFESGDLLEFEAINEKTLEPEHHPINCQRYRVGYILRFEDFPAGLAEGFAVLAITPEPGKWKEQEEYYNVYYECPICGEAYTSDYGTPEEMGWHFCPECGARVEGTARLPELNDEDEEEAET